MDSYRCNVCLLDPPPPPPFPFSSYTVIQPHQLYSVFKYVLVFHCTFTKHYVQFTVSHLGIWNVLYTVLQVETVFETYDQFFNLSPEVKAKYAKISITSPNGWDAVERERL